MHDFVAAVVVNQRAPGGRCALTRIGVFVELVAIEWREAVSVKEKYGKVEPRTTPMPVASQNQTGKVGLWPLVVAGMAEAIVSAFDVTPDTGRWIAGQFRSWLTSRCGVAFVRFR